MQNATLILDGQALILAIGKPTGLVTFGDFVNAFVQSEPLEARHEETDTRIVLKTTQIK